MKKTMMRTAGVVLVVVLLTLLAFSLVQADDTRVMFAEADENPYTGSLGGKGSNIEFTLDADLNSIGYDMETVQTVSEVRLHSKNTVSRLHRDNLSLYVSDDNTTWTRIKDWDLFRDGNDLILANFSAQARYVKVHCHFDNDDSAGFTNTLQNMMSVGTNVLEGYTKAKTVNSEAMAQTDTDAVIWVTKGDIPENARFVQNGTLLHHYYDGSGYYLRIPTVTTGESVAVDVYTGGSGNSLSDMDGVFEVIYGNRTLKNLDVTKDGEDFFKLNVAVTTAPDGTIIAIGDDVVNSARLIMRRSFDGGRTWTDAEVITDGTATAEGGGFLVDNGTIWYIHYYNRTAEGAMGLAYIKSTDNGATWTAPQVIDTGKPYNVIYCDGVKVASYDGTGPNIDYVTAYHWSADLENYSDFKTSVIYSCDGGTTWQSSESNISYGVASAGNESGVTEGAIAKLDNGDLILLARCQVPDTEYLAKSVSHDNGLTWEEEAVLSSANSPNTMPVLENYQDDILLLWAGNNSLGSSSLARFPLTLAYTADNSYEENWQQKLNVWAGTTKGDFYTTESFQNQKGYKAVQPSMTYANDGKDLYLAWWGNWLHNEGLLIEDFEDYLYKSKGAADDFESTSAVYDGWNVVDGTMTITDMLSGEGHGNVLKIDDTGTNTRVNRSVPMMNKGEISFDLNLETAVSQFLLECKSAFSTSVYKSNLFSIRIDDGGSIYAIDPDNPENQTVIGRISKTEWYRLTIRFDISAKTAALYIDGQIVGNLPVSSKNVDGGVSFIQICDSSAKRGMTAYIDNFIAYEGVVTRIEN